MSSLTYEAGKCALMSRSSRRDAEADGTGDEGDLGKGGRGLTGGLAGLAVDKEAVELRLGIDRP